MGDVGEGAKWWSFANACKSQLVVNYKRNNAFMEQWFFPAADVKVFVKMVAGQPQAWIYTEGGVYVESGFYDYGANNSSVAAFYRPATLHYNSVIASYIAGMAGPIQGLATVKASALHGVALAENYESKSVGCSAKLDEVTNDRMDTFTGGGFCDPGVIAQKKTCQLTVLPSLFSGKMQLFVQAMYGSTRTDYRVYALSSLIGPCMELSIEIPVPAGAPEGTRPGTQSVILSGFGANNSWLVTTDTYDYYLFTTVEHGYTYYPMILPSAAKPIQADLIAGGLSPDDVRRYETYLLAYAIPDIKRAKTVLVNHPMGLTIGGAGWAVSSDGFTCDRITQEVDEATKDYLATHHTLHLTYDAKGKTFGASLTQSDGSHWWPVGGYLNVIGPDYILGGAYKVQWATQPPLVKALFGNNSLPTNTSFEAPVYAYRDLHDVLQVVSVSHTATAHLGDRDLSEVDKPAQGQEWKKTHIIYAATNGYSYEGVVAIKINSDPVATGAFSLSGGYSKTTIKPRSGGGFGGHWKYSDGNNYDCPTPPGGLVGGSLLMSGLSMNEYALAAGYIDSGGAPNVADPEAGFEDPPFYPNMYPSYYAYSVTWGSNDTYYETEAGADMASCVFFELPYGSMNSCFCGSYTEVSSSTSVTADSTAAPVAPVAQAYNVAYWNAKTSGGFFTDGGSMGTCEIGYSPTIGAVTNHYAAAHSSSSVSYIGNTGVTYPISGVSNQGRFWQFDYLFTSYGEHSANTDSSMTCYTGLTHQFALALPAGVSRVNFPKTRAVGWA